MNKFTRWFFKPIWMVLPYGTGKPLLYKQYPIRGRLYMWLYKGIK